MIILGLTTSDLTAKFSFGLSIPTKNIHNVEENHYGFAHTFEEIEKYALDNMVDLTVHEDGKAEPYFISVSKILNKIAQDNVDEMEIYNGNNYDECRGF